MPNPYVNKVVRSNGTTLIDISDTTAVAADVASGKYFYLATGEKVTGTISGGVDVPVFTVTYDNNWDNVISVTCNKTYAECIAILEEGHTAAIFSETTQSGTEEYRRSGFVTATGTGIITYTTYNINVPLYDITYSRNGTLSLVEPSWLEDTLNVTTNGTYTPDAKVWTEVNVNVSGGAPSATQHTILFEFEDTTSSSITAYYDSSFISDAITATTPTEYGGKTVNSASLDGVEWYSAEAYVVLYEGTPEFYTDDGNYFWIPAMASVQPTVGSVWRITIDGTEYDCTAQIYGHADIDVIVGNPVHLGGTDDGSGVPVACYNYHNQAWVAQTTTFTAGGHTVKIERQGTA